MSTTVTVLVASALAFLLKLAGFVVPERWVEGERRSRITTLLPVALLAALIAVQTFGRGGHEAPIVDARAAAVVVAVVLLVLRANFLVVVVAAAVVAALLRGAGIG